MSRSDYLNLDSKNHKRVTKTVFKRFLKDNAHQLYVSGENGFEKAESTKYNLDYTLGIKNIWLVGRGDDYFDMFENNKFKGIEVTNAVGSFYVAIKI